jgi:hypothetical protein
MKRLTLIPFLILTTQNVFAYQIDKQSDEIILSSVNCDDVEDIYSSLAQWSKSIKQDVQCPDLVLPEDKKDCAVKITNCVPDHVKKYQSVNPTYSGPNCWNLALVMKDILPGLRYSTPEEMAFYMQPPLCRSLKNDEPLKAGDVGAIRNIVNHKIQESHGFIYISDKLAYSKNGFSKYSPYSLQTLENVYQVYDVQNKPECRSNQIDVEADCETAVSYYRCISLTEYLKKNPNVPKEVIDSLNGIGSFEGCALSKTAIDGDAIPEAFKNILKNSLMAITNYLIEQKKSLEKSKRSNPETDFIIGSIQLRLDAIKKQLSMTNERPLTYDMSELQYSFDKAAKNFKK